MAVIFLCVWGVIALGMGALFALRPAVAADLYIRQMGRKPLTRKLQQRLALRRAILLWYRAGGVVLIALGVLVPVLGLTGAIPT